MPSGVAPAAPQKRTCIARVSSVALVGMEARPVEVEVSVATGGLPDFRIVGLPSTAVREARRRVEAAVASVEGAWPQRKITANLAPGDLRKEGVLLDLPLAVGVVLAVKRADRERARRFLFAGELALDGRLRPVRGAVAAALAARSLGAEGLVLPVENAPEAALVPGVKVVGVSHLSEAIAFVDGRFEGRQVCRPGRARRECEDLGPDLADVKGQALARRALEICAAGSHNLLLIGPPGCGKTMLARRLPGILPPMTREEALEVTQVWSIAGLLGPGEALVASRPFRAPHHGASSASVIGGGSSLPTPGEVSLAHNGVLFLDELPLFSPSVLEGLRQPVEEGVVTVARTGATVRFPARISLVGAANPCLCRGAGPGGDDCTCPPGRVEAYLSRLSGPLLDRIDLHVDVASLTHAELTASGASEPSSAVRARVCEARMRSGARGPSGPGRGPADLLAHLDAPARAFLKMAFDRRRLSGRSLARTLRVARTIADLSCRETIGEEHVAEACQFRTCLWAS